MMQNRIDDALWLLWGACNDAKAKNPCSMWVLFAVSRYINTGRSSRTFEKRFMSLSSADMVALVRDILKGGRLSDDDIIRAVKKTLGAK